MITTGNVEHITLERFRTAFDLAPPGTTIVYATGHMSSAIERAPPGPGREELRALREKALQLSDDGRAALTQRKIAEDVFEYRLTKRR